MTHTASGRWALCCFAALAVAACGGGSDNNETPPPPSPSEPSATSGSTAFAVLATDTARIALVPLGAAGVLPVTIENTATAAEPPSRATVGPDGQIDASFDIDACSVDSKALQATCIGFDSTKVLNLNLGTYATTLKTADIVATEWDTDAPNRYTSFSGGSCKLCGVVSLPVRGSFIVAAQDGYREYPLPTAAGTALAARKVYAIPITENFGVDLGRSWLIASEYVRSFSGTGGFSRSLRLIRLDTGQVYVYDKDTGTCEDPADAVCAAFAFSEVDAAAIDPLTGLIVMQDEVGTVQMFVHAGQATFDDAKGSFSAPRAYRRLDQGRQFGETAGVLSSGTGNWAFLVSEFTSAGTIGVQKLPSDAAAPLASYTPDPVFVQLSALSQPTCGITSWFRTDPHAQGYTTTVAGRPLGLSVNGDGSCIAVVDLEALHGAPRDATYRSNLASGYDPVASGALRFLKTR